MTWSQNYTPLTDSVALSIKLQMKGKRIPAQWAVKKWQAADAFKLKVPLKPS